MINTFTLHPIFLFQLDYTAWADPIFPSFSEPYIIEECKPNRIRKLGFSFRKSTAVIALAKTVLEQQFLINTFENLADEEVIKLFMFIERNMKIEKKKLIKRNFYEKW